MKGNDMDCYEAFEQFLKDNDLNDAQQVYTFMEGESRTQMQLVFDAGFEAGQQYELENRDSILE